jgi:hypothetical protein
MNKFIANLVLMIFLFSWFVMPLKVSGQKEQGGYMTIEEIEAESGGENSWKGPYLINEGEEASQPPDYGEKNYNAFPFYASALTVNLQDQRNELTGMGGNYINLEMNGKYNNVETMQQGKKNIMKLDIDANYSKGNKYQQIGNKNYIADRVSGNGIHHEIYQEGDNLAVQNQGMQTIPMIINQRGQGMHIRITGSPLP